MMTAELLDRVSAVFGLGNEDHVRLVRDQSSDPRSEERVVVDGQHIRTVALMGYPGNGALQSVLRPLYGDRLYPPTVQAAISGHIHLFEAVSFTTAQPTQLIAGTGGDWADVALPRPLPAGATPAQGAMIGSIVSSNQPGFTLMEREDDGTWRVEARDAGGIIMTTCTLRETKLKCVPETLP
jgi:hypothetical protein